LLCFARWPRSSRLLGVSVGPGSHLSSHCPVRDTCCNGVTTTRTTRGAQQGAWKDQQKCSAIRAPNKKSSQIPSLRYQQKQPRLDCAATCAVTKGCPDGQLTSEPSAASVKVRAYLTQCMRLGAGPGLEGVALHLDVAPSCCARVRRAGGERHRRRCWAAGALRCCHRACACVKCARPCACVSHDRSCCFP
jgi:hypothetical protein